MKYTIVWKIARLLAVGLNYDEIAEATGIKRETVRAYAFRARRIFGLSMSNLRADYIKLVLKMLEGIVPEQTLASIGSQIAMAERLRTGEESDLR